MRIGQSSTTSILIQIPPVLSTMRVGCSRTTVITALTLLAEFRANGCGGTSFAIADGVVTALTDGNFDRNTWYMVDRPPANRVTISHESGYRSVYTHLRRGSVTVSVGQAVTQGQVIGLVGSSGNSGWPHLHLTVQENSTAIETYVRPPDYWITPIPYTGDAPGILATGITNYRPNMAELVEQPSEMRHFTQAPDQSACLVGHV